MPERGSPWWVIPGLCPKEALPGGLFPALCPKEPSFCLPFSLVLYEKSPLCLPFSLVLYGKGALTASQGTLLPTIVPPYPPGIYASYPPFVGRSSLLGCRSRARTRCTCGARVAHFTLLAGGPQGLGFASRDLKNMTFSSLSAPFCSPEGAITGGFPANSIRDRM